jgi:hypothetical protein
VIWGIEEAIADSDDSAEVIGKYEERYCSSIAVWENSKYHFRIWCGEIISAITTWA